MSSTRRPSFSRQGFRVPPLRLRPPKLDGLQAVTAIHSDPRTNIHNPAGASTPEECQEQLNAWILDWERDQLGYWIIQECGSGEILGVGGLRKTGEKLHERAMLNLYYRFSPDAWGRGLA